jgi:hypothetical protein
VPVVGERSRTYYQIHRSLSNLPILSYLCLLNLLALVEYDTQRLQCLTQSHIIAQCTVQVIVTQLGHPIDALFLVLSQLECSLLLHWHDQVIFFDDFVVSKHLQKVHSFLGHLCHF